MKLAAPLYLLLILPVVFLLIYAYLNKGQGRKVVVASVFILQKLQKKYSLRSKLNFPLRFFYDLLLALLLVLIVAGFSTRNSQKSISILIDNSLSTAAKLGEESIFNQNKSALIAELKREGADDKYQLCWTSPTFQCSESGFSDYQTLLGGLSELEEVRSLDKIDFGVKQLSIADLTFLVTDKTPQGFKSGYRIINSKSRLLNNLAISTISYQRNLSEIKYQVEVDNFSNSPVEDFIYLDFFILDKDKNEWKVSGRRKLDFFVK